MTNHKNLFSRTLVYFIFLLIYVSLLTAFNVHCPFAFFLGIKCPTCGISRALISLLSLDLKSYFSYHPLAIPMVVSVWILITQDLIKFKRSVKAAAMITVVLNFIIYLINVTV